MSLLFFSNKTAFLHVFLRAISFFQSLSILSALQTQHFARIKRIAKAAFCKSRAHRGTRKGGKMSVPFFSNQIGIFACIFTCHFVFSKSFSILLAVAKAAFCKSRAHRGTPKGGKMSVPFLSESNGIFSCIFTCHFIFSKSFSILLPLQKQHFASLERIGVPQKEEKCHFSFSLIKRHFFMYFYVPFHFFKLFFNFDFRCKSSILQV